MIRNIIIFMLFGHGFVTCFGRKSGLYIDNGVDQTIVQRLMSKQEKREVEHEILNLLGLDYRPRPYANSTTLGASGPKFLLDIYKSLLDTPSRSTRSEFNLSGRDLHAIDESDAIMTFTSKSKGFGVANVRHEHGKHLWFDVSDISAYDTIVDAELRLYQSPNYSDDLNEKFTVTIYLLISQDGLKELEYVDAVNTTLTQEGWLIFNTTGPIMSWVAAPQQNKGLYLSVHPVNKFGHEMKPEDIGIVSASVEGQEEKQPFMVAFMKTTGTKPKRSSRRARDTRRRKKAENSDTSFSRNPFTDDSPPWSTRTCQIQTLYVSFRDLGWQDWIIAPDGYGAFFCQGECHFPLSAHMNATNHAIVQTLVHLMDPRKVPTPHCAPTKLSSISVLYFLEDQNVVLKKYNNMVVKSCGCH